jgi:VanZ family protein
MIKKNKFSILFSLIILYLSLANASTFEKAGLFDIKYLDKFVHFGLYFIFMGVIILEHRQLFSNTRQIIIVALIPVIFGAVIELMQSGFTDTRKADILDIMFNTAGTATAVCIWLFYEPYYKRKNSDHDLN